MEKIYVLDTNVLLADCMGMFKFEDNTVVIPSVVLEEIDTKKKFMDSIGFNARAVGRQLDELRKIGNLAEGITLPNGGTLKVALKKEVEVVENKLYSMTNDNLIIATALAEKQENPDTPVVLVSRDALVRIKADTLGLHAEDYLNDKVLTADDEQYKGYTVVDVDPKTISSFKRRKQMEFDLGSDIPPNHYVILQNGSQQVLARYKGGYIEHPYCYEGGYVFGVEARNIQQHIALDLLLNPDIHLVTMAGKAGTGKTLLALAAGLEQVLEKQDFEKVIAARPVVPMGKDIGYLPGEMEDKLRPWMQPIYDNLEFIFNCKERKESIDKILVGMQNQLQVEALTYIRGRSIPDQFIIIDEAQNLTKHEVKTILTRVGEGSKIVLMGDPEQIDHPYLDQYNNGLTYVVEKMKDQEQTGHVTFKKGERSSLAQLCADLL